TCTPRISTLSLHDALPIFGDLRRLAGVDVATVERGLRGRILHGFVHDEPRFEELNGELEVAVARRNEFELLGVVDRGAAEAAARSEEHTSELQSRVDLVCR